MLEAGIRAARAGNRPLARRLLVRVTELQPMREDAWLWLAGVAESREETLAYLQTVLAINPNNRQAQEGIAWVSRQAEPEREAAHGQVEPADTAGPASGMGGEAASASPAGEGLRRLVLSVAQVEAIERCLDALADRIKARCIIVADVTGQLIAERGQTSTMNTQVLSALAAGELVATHELARLVGERARFKLLLNEGENQNVYLSDVGEQLIVIIVSDQNTLIGMVRLVLKQAVDELAPILAQAGSDAAVEPVDEALGGDFARLLENELDASLTP